MEVETMNDERQIYEKIEIEAEKGTNFEISNETKGKLVIIVKKIKLEFILIIMIILQF